MEEIDRYLCGLSCCKFDMCINEPTHGKVCSKHNKISCKVENYYNVKHQNDLCKWNYKLIYNSITKIYL